MTFEKQQCRVKGAAVECRRTSVSRLARNALNSSQAAKDTHNVYKSRRSTPNGGGTRARAWAPRAPRAAGWNCSPAPRSHLLHPVPRIASSSSGLHGDSPERPLREGGGLRTPARVSQRPRAPLGGALESTRSSGRASTSHLPSASSFWEQWAGPLTKEGPHPRLRTSAKETGAFPATSFAVVPRCILGATWPERRRAVGGWPRPGSSAGSELELCSLRPVPVKGRLGPRWVGSKPSSERAGSDGRMRC